MSEDEENIAGIYALHTPDLQSATGRLVHGMKYNGKEQKNRDTATFSAVAICEETSSDLGFPNPFDTEFSNVPTWAVPSS